MNALRVLAVALFVGTLSTVAAPKSQEKKSDYAKMVVGKWEATKADSGTVPEGTIIEFTKDGKMKIFATEKEADFAIDGTYKMDENKIKFTIKIGDAEKTNTITITKISDKEMSTKDKDSKQVEFKKVK